MRVTVAVREAVQAFDPDEGFMLKPAKHSETLIIFYWGARVEYVLDGVAGYASPPKVVGAEGASFTSLSARLQGQQSTSRRRIKCSPTKRSSRLITLEAARKFASDCARPTSSETTQVE